MQNCIEIQLPVETTVNRLYFGDNLGWLRNTKEFPDSSVDLVYLDPPSRYCSAMWKIGERRGEF